MASRLTYDPIDLTSEGNNLSNSMSSGQARGTEDRPINIDGGEGSDDEDEDLKLAIALSLQDQENSELTSAIANHVPISEGISQKTDATETKQLQTEVTVRTPFLGLDRKAMEAERLARLKRKREETDVCGEGSNATSQSGTTSSRAISPPVLKRAGARSREFGKGDQADVSNKTIPTTSGSSADLVSEPMQPCSITPTLYPDGTVLQTRVSGYPETAQNISFSSLISPKSNLKTALLSSFIWDFDWLFPHFNTKTTNFHLVMHAKHTSERLQIQKDFEGVPNVRLCFPPMEGQVNCMHSKLMLLFYENDNSSAKGNFGPYAESCRIIVPTANLTGMDWGVGRIMENTMWVIDLPVLADDPKARSNIGKAAWNEVVPTEFQNSLCAFLEAQTVSEGILHKLNKHNFSRTKNIGFVHSIGGSHGDKENKLDGKTQTAWWSTGHCGLGRTISSLGLASPGPIRIDFVTSSLGSLNDEFMRSMYLACQGDNGLTEYTLRTSKSFPTQLVIADTNCTQILPSTVRKTTGEEWHKNFHFYFPSNDTVLASNGGPDHAGTICFSKKWWGSPKFPRKNMKDCVSLRNGLLMHNKIIFIRFENPIIVGEHHHLGWTYVGSANLSESAWGRLVQDKVSKKPKLNCKNWECGVIIPTERKVTGVGLTNDNLAIFSRTIPVPMVQPGADYQNTSRLPWCIFG